MYEGWLHNYDENNFPHFPQKATGEEVDFYNSSMIKLD